MKLVLVGSGATNTCPECTRVTAPRSSGRRSRRTRQTDLVLTVFGVTVLSFMMLMYGLERRHSAFVLAFAVGCALSSLYGFLSGAWPFGVVEAIWTVVALHRYVKLKR